MDDRRMLELAARAAGIKKHYPFGKDAIYVRWTGLWTHRDTSDDEGALKLWSPLADDGDALRLAVKLRLTLLPLDASVTAAAGGGPWAEEKFNGDPHEATRLAITRAAAAIGEQMEGK